MELNGREYCLADDGTMDTVVNVECQICGEIWEERLDCEAASFYRDEDTGDLIDLNGLVEDYLDNEPCPHCDL